MSVIEKVKTAKRIRHTGIDTEINRLDKVARANMVRAGVNEEKANSEDDSLIEEAVVTFVLSKIADTPEMQQKYEEAYRLQVDELRRSRGYKCTTTSSNLEA